MLRITSLWGLSARTTSNGSLYFSINILLLQGVLSLKLIGKSTHWVRMFQTPFAERPWIILLGQKTQNCSRDLTQRCRLYQKHGLVTKSEAQLSLFLLYFSQISYLNYPKENPVLTSTQVNKLTHRAKPRFGTV